MEVAIVILSVIAAAETVWLILLWRQNMAICRQLAFIREKDSAMRVSVNAEMLGELAIATEINKTLDDVRDRKHAMSEREKLIAALTAEMRAAAKILEFEHAAYLRDKIEKLRNGK